MTRKKRIYHGWFPALLLLTLLCCAPKALAAMLPAKPQPVQSNAEDSPPRQETAPAEATETEDAAATEEVHEPLRRPLGKGPEKLLEEPEADAPEKTPEKTPEQTPEKAPEQPPQEPPQEELPPPTMEEYFADVLFIGDSRTVGLSEYAGLDTAAFFADVGMNVYQVLKNTCEVAGVGTVTLEELLEQRSFGKIHLMLGINELGYDFNTTVETYTAVVETIRALQPEAVIYLGANLHVDQSRSDWDTVINNPAIDRFNEAVAELADGDQIRYLDVNPLFDDENGALNDAYSGDGTHPYGACYPQWAAWLFEAMREETA